MYDWANSVYSLTITTAIFPVYYRALTGGESGEGSIIHFLGLSVHSDSLYSYTLSAAFLFAALLSPILSGIADHTDRKKFFMKLFCYVGSLSCALMYFFDHADRLWLGLPCFALAAIGYTGSIVFYNAYLPEIAPPERQDRLSAQGFALGYVGSVLLLVVNLTLVMFPGLIWDVQSRMAELAATMPDLDPLALKEAAIDSYAGIASRIAFLAVGIWWFAFAQITFSTLPKATGRQQWTTTAMRKGFEELRKVIRNVSQNRVIKRFLASFFLFSMGIQTVMFMATIFASKELNIETGTLIMIVLIIQLIAIPGAWLMAKASERWGNIPVIAGVLCIWILVAVGAYLVQNTQQFFALAAVVGFAMGGTQALSRSTFSKLLSGTSDTASYFSLYDLCEKLSMVLGMLVFGLLHDLTGEMRTSAIAILAFFAMALWLWLRLGRPRPLLPKSQLDQQ